MAMDGSPTVIEPTTSPDSPLPKIPGLSHHQSSSSGSFDSSRPNSQPSSTTSRSVSLSPIAKSVPAIDSHESIELPAWPSTPPHLESPPQRQNELPRSAPPAPAVSPRADNEVTLVSRLRYLIPTGICFTNTLGVLSLLLALIGMIVFGIITLISVWNEAVADCAQLRSVSRSAGMCLTLFECS